MRSAVKVNRWFSVVILILFGISAWSRLKKEVTAPEAPEARKSERERGANRRSTRPTTNKKTNTAEAERQRTSGDEYAGLREVGRGTYESPKGLRYRRGSEDGHRWKHVLRHATNEPDHPGKYGVFLGEPVEILALLDEAYVLSKNRGRQVQTRNERGRTIHDVDMGRKIGYIGGKWGRSRGTPSTSKVRLVLERDSDVITSYPVN